MFYSVWHTQRTWNISQTHNITLTLLPEKHSHKPPRPPCKRSNHLLLKSWTRNPNPISSSSIRAAWEILPAKISEVRRRECKEWRICPFPPCWISGGLDERKPPVACTMMSRLALNPQQTLTNVKTYVRRARASRGSTDMYHLKSYSTLISSYH